MNTDFRNAITGRKSVRNYTPAVPETDILVRVQNLLKSHNTGPFGNSSRFWIIDKSGNAEQRLKLGTYGFIKGATIYFAGAMKAATPMNHEDYGYVKERKILEFTNMQLGTCWIGGTFRRSEFAKTIHLHDNEIISTISPLGLALPETGMGKIIKSLAGSYKRKVFGDLFFENSFESSIVFNELNPIHQALEMVRLGPSANNAQPWRILLQNEKAHFYLARNKAIDTLKKVDLQRVDMGIAMCHFELSLRECGISGKWMLNNPNSVAPKNLQYICSFSIETQQIF